MELPASFSGSEISASPQRGPEPSSRMSLAIFMRLQASVLRAPWTSTMASWHANASNLFLAVTNGRPAGPKYRTVMPFSFIFHMHYFSIIDFFNFIKNNWTHLGQAEYEPRLFHRLKIGRFSGSLAELFLAPPIAALSVESRSVPAVVNTSRLLLIFNLWAAECTRCFLYFKWVFPVVNILMLWCMFAVFQCCFVLYVLCVYCAHFHSLHERPSCQNGILSLHPLRVFLWELGLILNKCFL